VSVVTSVFVSHANADAALVDEFVDTVLRNGCNLTPEDIFYTSGEDTGIASGSDLIATVREKVGDATLVIAIVTRTYQTRPVCVAELGAAWGRAGANSLMPLLLPGIGRGELEGVFEGMTIRTLADSAALDELHDRVAKATSKTATAATWTRHKQAWLRKLAGLVASVPEPPDVSPATVEQLKKDLEGSSQALDDLESENAELARQLDEVGKLKDAAEVAVATLPLEDEERFADLVRRVQSEFKGLDGIVKDAIWSNRFGPGLVRPGVGDYRAEQADENVDDGFLYEGDERILYPNTDSTRVENAMEAIDNLERFLVDCGERFAGWFKQEYGFQPGLRNKAVWDELF
jgi:hypothetical protein